MKTMNKLLLILSSCLLLITSCREKNAQASIPRVPRDTTITPQNAVTQLSLDSLLVEKFISNEVESDTIATKIRNFYNARNYQYAWFFEGGLSTQAEGFWNLHKRHATIGDSTLYNQRLHQVMDTLLDADTTFPVSPDIKAMTELRLTQHFFRYIQFAYEGRVSPEQMQWHIPRRKLDAAEMLDSLVSKNKMPDDWQPLNPSFHRLQNALFRYDTIEKNGGWDSIHLSKRKLVQGDRAPVIVQVKKRLSISDNYPSVDTSNLFTDTLETAVNRKRKSYGMEENGEIDADFIKELNVPVKKRIEQMLINLERMRWMPEQPAHFIVANIPSYRLHVVENNQEKMKMDIVVGKAANKTVIFSDELKYVVFSPYWNIPKSIVRREIVPAMNRNKNYLRKNNMEITGYTDDDLPVIRQKPGPGNALGKVKFIFPNRFNIYFHDTPAKQLFGKQKRAFSHGCIRLEKPFSLADYLLRDKEKWTDESINEAMNSGEEKWVSLEKPVPVFITYFTSWADGDGLVYFIEDVYGHDERMAQHLFAKEE